MRNIRSILSSFLIEDKQEKEKIVQNCNEAQNEMIKKRNNHELYEYAILKYETNRMKITLSNLVMELMKVDTLEIICDTIKSMFVKNESQFRCIARKMDGNTPYSVDESIFMPTLLHCVVKLDSLTSLHRKLKEGCEHYNLLDKNEMVIDVDHKWTRSAIIDISVDKLEKKIEDNLLINAKLEEVILIVEDRKKLLDTI